MAHIQINSDGTFKAIAAKVKTLTVAEQRAQVKELQVQIKAYKQDLTLAKKVEKARTAGASAAELRALKSGVQNARKILNLDSLEAKLIKLNAELEAVRAIEPLTLRPRGLYPKAKPKVTESADLVLAKATDKAVRRAMGDALSVGNLTQKEAKSVQWKDQKNGSIHIVSDAVRGSGLVTESWARQHKTTLHEVKNWLLANQCPPYVAPKKSKTYSRYD